MGREEYRGTVPMERDVSVTVLERDRQPGYLLSMARSRRTSSHRRISYEGVRHYRRDNVFIEFTLERSGRRTIGLTVFPGGKVRIRAPWRASETSVMALVAGREEWIVQKQKLLAALPQVEDERFRPGYSIRFLGRERKIILGNPEAPQRSARFRRDAIIVDGATTPRGIYRVVYQKYREAALRVFQQRLKTLRKDPLVTALGRPAMLSLRLMRRRWGSCFSDRRITLNPELCAAAIPELDYVILHELCHLREHNHSPRFYHLLDHRMPDWRHRRERLNREVPIGFLRSP